MPEVSFHVDRSAERRQQLAQPALQVPAGAVRPAHARRIDVQQRSDPRDPRGHVVADGPVLGEPVVAEIDEAELGQGVRTHLASRGARRFMTASDASLALYQTLARTPKPWFLRYLCPTHDTSHHLWQEIETSHPRYNAN